MNLRVTHVITSLSGGGAEGALVRLCLASRQPGCTHSVISLSGRGKHAATLESAGISVTCLGMRAGVPDPLRLWRLIRLIRAAKTDVVQTWMYHADLIGGIAARLAGVRAVCWNIRSTVSDASTMKRSTFWVARMCAFLSSYVPRKIVICSKNAVEPHANLGYSSERFVVVPNGYEFSVTPASNDARTIWRAENRLQNTLPLLGLVGRYSPPKDHLNLLRALRELKHRETEFHCVLVGNGCDPSNAELVAQIDGLELGNEVSLLGERSDIPAVMRALDLHVLSSRIEGFPNVVAESMAAGTPCVSTDAGDAGQILGSLGWLVPAQNSTLLAAAIEAALRERRERPADWQQRQEKCRNRILENFSLDRMVGAYTQLWQDAVRSSA
ncbi:MAG: glycosyltransferase [Gammaproteobacteria bacterium]|nr:glycosyltransferase [Gammaproteobacteria bacterium]